MFEAGGGTGGGAGARAGAGAGLVVTGTTVCCATFWGARN